MSRVPWQALYALAIVLMTCDQFVMGGIYRRDAYSMLEYMALMPNLVYLWLAKIVAQ